MPIHTCIQAYILYIYNCTHFLANKYDCFREARSLTEKIIELHMNNFTCSRHCVTVYLYTYLRVPMQAQC